MAFYFDTTTTTTQLRTQIPKELHVNTDNRSNIGHAHHHTLCTPITLPSESSSPELCCGSKSMDATPLRAAGSRAERLNTLRKDFKFGFFNDQSTDSKPTFGAMLNLSKANGENSNEHTQKTFDGESLDSERSETSLILTQRSGDFVLPKHKVFKSYSVMSLDELNDLCDDNPHIHKLFGPITDYFEILEKLGEGTSALVKKCIRISDKQTLALKIVNFRGDQELLIQIANEFKNHQKLNHPSVIKVHDLYIDMQENKVYISMDFIKGQDLLSFVAERGPFQEKSAMGICKKILHGLNYLHYNGICHRDIKPENILASSDYSEVKIVDFNVSKFIGSKEKRKYSSLEKTNYRMWTDTGTYLYKAPEILIDQAYTEAVDMWSIGCTLYFMLSGSHPFQSEFMTETIERIKNVDYNFDQNLWQTISKEAKDLIASLLKKNFKERPSPGEALLSAWFHDENEQVLIIPFQFTRSEKRGRLNSIVPQVASKTKKNYNQKSRSVDDSKRAKRRFSSNMDTKKVCF